MKKSHEILIVGTLATVAGGVLLYHYLTGRSAIGFAGPRRNMGEVPPSARQYLHPAKMGHVVANAGDGDDRFLPSGSAVHLDTGPWSWLKWQNRNFTYSTVPHIPLHPAGLGMVNRVQGAEGLTQHRYGTPYF